MFKSYEEFQTLGKDGWEAFTASSTALTKGVQAVAQDSAEFSRKSFEKGTATIEKVFAAKSFDKAIELQQAFAKEAYEDLVSQMNKVSEMWVSAAKEVYKPYEASLSAFGIKAPK
jgi:phasin family protein